jgi:hypothetical protein
LLLNTVTLTELLHLVAALGGSLGRRCAGEALAHGGGHRIPIGRAEIAAAESVPSLTVGFDEN